MAGSTRTAIGHRWERQALEYLRSHGLEPIAENYRCRLGEIDLIMRDRDCLVFVEVRYRGNSRFATAAESVDGLKQRKLIRAAALYLAGNPRLCDMPVRFDVIAVDAALAGQCTLQWLRDAFRAEA
ncbi:MAG: YraN family protein [Woeseiaceae bacterium]|nr:YraN family protein [Woeseiaceae bacterium]